MQPVVVVEQGGTDVWLLLLSAAAGAALAVAGGFLRQLWTDHRATKAASVALLAQIRYARAQALEVLEHIVQKQPWEPAVFSTAGLRDASAEMSRTRRGRRIMGEVNVFARLLESSERSMSGTEQEAVDYLARVLRVAPVCVKALWPIAKDTGSGSAARRALIGENLDEVYGIGATLATVTDEDLAGLPAAEQEVVRALKHSLGVLSDEKERERLPRRALRRLRRRS